MGEIQQVRLVPGTRAEQIYGRNAAEERFACNYGLNEAFRGALEGRDLVVSGVDRKSSVRIVELPAHPFFIATLFLPQYCSEPGAPHPLIRAFAAAAAGQHEAMAR